MQGIQKESELSPIESFRRKMDRFFDDIDPLTHRSGNGGMQMELWAPDTDVSETEDEYMISVDLPGISKENVEINYKDNRLTISGERKQEEKKEEKDFLRKERYHGTFTRSFSMPSDVKGEDIRASFKDGVLTVKIPKSKVEKSKSIQID